jgi:hypothetical protein
MKWLFRSNLALPIAVTAALSLGGQVVQAAPAGKTSVSITRSSDMLYMAMSASVEVNGQKVASLERGETYTGVVAPGPVEIRVSNWSAPGASSYSFKATPGKTYRFTVSPHGGNFVASLAGGLIGSAIEGHGAFEIAPAQ